jgi:hypothetical protein
VRIEHGPHCDHPSRGAITSIIAQARAGRDFSISQQKKEERAAMN